ncbi:unnamed protein product [Clavelina lepadiformis]|uniref:Uncharacterized protein n=1 Tax=Clavelina lepadiformis TaxID=159417 RepID=A0ABP0G5Q9_CLALP
MAVGLFKQRQIEATLCIGSLVLLLLVPAESDTTNRKIYYNSYNTTEAQIIGGIVSGVIALICLIVMLVVYCYKRKCNSLSNRPQPTVCTVPQVNTVTGTPGSMTNY